MVGSQFTLPRRLLQRIAQVVLRPVVQGLVYSTSTADFISELTLNHVGLDRFRDLLFKILVDHAGIDLAHFKRKGAPEPLWTEITRLQQLRNRVIHRAEVVEPERAGLSVSVAEAVLGEIFPAVITHLGLHLHEGVRICNGPLCQFEGILSAELIARLQGRSVSAPDQDMHRTPQETADG